MNQRVDLSQTYPLTAAQHDIWLDQMTQGDSPLYTIGGHIEIKGHLDLARFRQAVDLLIQKHDALRTVLLADEHEGGSPMQELAAVLPVPLGGHDVRGHADPHAAAQAWMQQQIQIPFALYGGPLLRFHLLQLADASFYFVAHVHHLIQDGWGMSLMFDSLGELYSALEKGAQPALSAPSYAQFVHDDAHYRESPRYGRDQAYWLNKYREVPAPLFVARYRDQYPDRKAPSWEVVRRYRQALNVQIDALAQALRVSRVQVLLAALCVYFARTCGRDELVIGLPILNRSNAMFRNTLGLFTQVSAVRLACQGPLSFAELAQQIARTLKQDYRHQRYPLSEINRSLGLRRQGRAQLFDLGFSYEQVDRQFLYGAAPASVVKGSSHHEQTPLTLHLRTNPHDETAWLHFTYNQAYWQHAEVEAMAEGFMQVLEQGLADDRLALQDFVLPAPAEPAGEAPATGLYPAGNLAGSATLPVGERHRVLVDFNATAVQYPSGHTIHGLFQAQAARQPEAIALRQGDQQLSFHALNQRANQLAHCLLEHGLRPDDRVAICARRSLENLIGMLAVLKAGAAYVPIDPAYPPERIRYLLEDSAPVLILAQASTRTLVAHSELAVIELDSDHWHRHPTVNPDVADLTPANLAYVIYTSGSTGQPKGVMVEHRTLENLVHWNSAAFDLCAGRHASSVAGVGFDAVAWEVWPALCGGATLHLSPAQQDHENIDALLQWWVAQPLDVSFLPTPVAEYALSQGIEHPTLKTLLVGGDRLRHFSTPQRFQLVNNYGPAETTVAATSGLIEAGQPLHIGKPIGNTQVYVLDAQRQPVAQGVVGEVYVGGAGVARGYLNRPQMTAERFLKDPFSPDPQARLYRTGDLARWLEDGNLDFQGRNDDQVKIRGVRIELGEIETCLGKHPHIAEAVVLARDERLVAYFTEHQAVSLETLRDWLQAHLPGYLVPAAYVRLDSLPLTVNGKLDRKALPEPGPDALLRRAYEAPQGAVETALAQIWAEVLKVRQVGRHDNFFELGGHSLLAVNLTERMRQIGLGADVRVLFSQPTIAALAATVGGGREVAVPANLITPDCTRITPALLPLITLDQADIDRIVTGVPGGVANVQDIYALAPLQEGILYHHITAEQGDPYLLQAQMAFDSVERLHQFAQALQGVVDRHDILRTGIVWEGLSTPAQVVWRKAKLPVLAVTLDPADGDILSQLYARFDARHYRVDVSQAPLMRLVYVRDEANARTVAVLFFHHMVLDHTALDGVRQEVAATLSGASEPLAPAVPYRNYVAQVHLGAGEQAHEAFFREMLGDIDAPTLPFGLKDVQGDGHAVAEATQRLPHALSLRLRAAARTLGVSVASLFHLAYARVLSVVSSQHNVVFGTVLMGRLQGGEGADRALGMFINTLPLRVNLDQTVQAGVRSTQARLSALLGHEQASLALAQRCCGVAAPSPLFSAMLNYRHSASDGVMHATRDAWAGIQMLASEERTNYPLVLNVDDQGDGFELGAQVAGADAGRVVAYMQTALHNLMDALDTAPHTPLQHVQVVPADEREALLAAFSDTAPEPAPPHTLHHKVEARAAAHPDATAVLFDDQRLSYGELNRRANQVAHRLLALGVRPDDRVAICVERGLEMIVGLLGILKAGAGYVPIDPAYPQERISYTLQDSAPVAVLVQAATASRVAELSVPVLDLASADLQAQAVTNPHVPGLTSANLAYVIYTSGSTGLPKGVMIEHRNVSRLFTATEDWFNFNDQDVWALFHSFAFDFSVWEIWGALVHGGQLLVVPQLTSRSPDECYALLCSAGVTILNQTPSAFRSLIVAQGQSDLSHSLRQVIFGGEALEPGILKPWYARVANAGTQLVNMYGITETTVHVTYRALEAADAQLVGVSPIGGRIPDLQLYVLDERREPVPVGVVGELYVGGAGVARGYLNRPELNAERFIADPFSGRADARLYKTGDLGRRLADGSIDYLGRNDDQVKIRGFRIELGEIEARLAACEGVREAVVVAREDEPGDKRLVAYVIGAEGTPPSAAELRTQLLVHLAEYMVPGAFVMLDSFPLTTNGKLDRKALPAPDADALARRQYEAPQGEVETLIAGIWQELLGVEQVGRQDHFFELGGHSLLAVNLIGRMRQVGLSADVRVLFGQPTLAALAAAVGGDHEVAVPANRISADCTRITPELLPLANLDQASIDRIVASVPGGTANVQDIYPLAPLQEGIFYHHLSAEQGDPYLLQARFSFADNSRLEAFAQALQAVIDRHDILRTSIVWEGLSTPMQVVWRTARLTVRAIELDAADGDVLSQLQTRFDARRVRLEVTQAPLMQLLYAQDPVNQRVVGVLLFHHLALDHVASKGLWQELQTRLAGNPHQLAASVPYRNYVAQARLGVSEQAHEAFFCELLKDIDEPTLPFGLQEVQGDARGIEEATHTVGNALSLRLRAQAQRLGVSAASLFHQAWANVLATTSGQTTVVFGTVLLGRMRGGEGAERALGMYINTLPLRIEVGREDVRTGVRQTHARLTALLGHEHAPLALAQRCSGVAAPSPLFSALLNYRHGVLADAGEEAAHAWRGIELVGAQERTNYPLTLNVDDTGDNFSLTALVTTPIDAERVCGYMQVALDSVVTALETAPHTALQDLAVLPMAERQQVLRTWNTTDAFYPHDALVHQPFEAWARVQPDAVAVVYEDRHLTYGELNARANQLAHQLLALGVRPDDRVAICVARGLDMIVGLLGILKSGAGYVPIDPASPAERIAYMLDDSTPMVLVTQTPLLDQLPVLDLPTLLLDASPDAGMAQHNPQPAGLTSRHLAYVIYTSGSTGLPKGVMVEHRNVARLFSATQPWFDFGPQDVWALFHSFAFDFSVWEIWGALTHGGRLLVVPQLISRSPPSCYALLCEAGVTVLNQTPSAFRQLIAAQGESDLKHRLRQVIFGGEALETGLLKPWYAREVNAHTQLVNMYGITETTVHVTYRALTAADAQHVGGSPIGGRIPDLQLYVLDARREPVPIGVTGELYVGGAGVARGYLNRPALTAERFLRNPFSSDPGARLYRTGDLGRWLADGSVEYLGRNDEQVKIRGFRIELGEIEARLAACDGVREAVVIAREDEPGDKRLVAYVIARENTELAVADLRRQLLLTLADYMVPSAFVQLDAWPLTTNGKLDRKRLPAPGQAAVVARDYVAPQTAQEQTLVAIWQDILNVPQVGLQDDFFELGGDSIRIITLISRVQKAFPASRVSIMAFYQAPTVQGLAAWLTQEAELPHEWLPELTRGAHDPELALVCVPYAGASAMVFQPLADQLRQRLPSARVYAVALPGNQMETRFDDSLDLMGIARACVERIGQRIAGPVSIYGHCAGSVLAMEIARQLEQQGREVRFVMLGGTFAPPGWIKYIPWNNPWRWHSDLALRRRMTAWGNTSAMGALNEAELTGLLRSFRRDSGLALQHLKRQGLRQIVAPIVSVLSLDDPLTQRKEARYRVWGRYTQAVHGVLLADGGHYFVGSRAAEVADVVLDTHQHRDRLMSTPATLRTWPGAER